MTRRRPRIVVVSVQVLGLVVSVANLRSPQLHSQYFAKQSTMETQALESRQPQRSAVLPSGPGILSPPCVPVFHVNSLAIKRAPREIVINPPTGDMFPFRQYDRLLMVRKDRK